MWRRQEDSFLLLIDHFGCSQIGMMMFAGGFCEFYLLILLMTLAGTPTATALSGIFEFTKLKAPTIQFSPTVTPGIATL